VTGTELRIRRERLGLSHAQVSDLVGDHPEELRGYETIAGQLPRALRRRLEWALANAERAQFLRENGVEDCVWVEEQLRGLDFGNRRAVDERVAAINAHAQDCPVCLRRHAVLITLPPLPPPPLSPAAGLLTEVAARVSALPRWVRPAAVGALLMGTVAVIRAIATLFLRGGAPSPRLLLVVLGSIGLGAYGGLVGGVAYALVREPSRRWGRLGDYATGLVCAYAFLLAFGIPAALSSAENTFRTPGAWAVLGAMGTLFGLVIGHHWFRSDTSGAGALR
jgi:hypothetical protein